MGVESGFSTPRCEVFPAGLRVLVVDDDPTWLKILEKMLKKCSYEVTTSGLAREALRLLRDRKDGFDIVISDVNMPDMDGFKLLEHVGLEMDLPVIMMSVDGETSRVMKGVQHGACDYLLKPIRMKELKNIWQHVVRKRLHEVRDIEFIEDRNGTDHFDDGHYGGDQTLLKKRKDVDNKHGEKDSSDPSSKKARVVWTVELHQKFVKAVNQIGIDSDKVGPKKILDLMNVPWLTRENVASHLQKYRLYLSRIRKEDNMGNSFGGIKNPDHSPKESSGSISLQHSSFGQQNDVTSNFVYPANHLPVPTLDSTPVDKDFKRKTLHRKPVNNENSDPQRVSNRLSGLSNTFQPPEASVNFASFDSPVSGRYHWSGELPDLQFKPELKPQPNLEECFNQPAVPILQQQIQADLLEPALGISPGPPNSRRDNLGLIDVKPLNEKQVGDNIRQLTPVESVQRSFSALNPETFGCGFDMSLGIKFQNPGQESNSITEKTLLERPILSSESHISDVQGVESSFNETMDKTIQNPTYRGGMIDYMVGQSNVNGPETELRYQGVGNESTVGLLGEDLMFRWLQASDGPSKDFNILDHVDEVPLPPCASKLGLEYEFPFDWIEYPVGDQGLLFS